MPISFYNNYIRDDILSRTGHLFGYNFGKEINDFSSYREFKKALRAGLSIDMQERPTAKEFSTIINSLYQSILIQGYNKPPSISHETHFINPSSVDTLAN